MFVLSDQNFITHNYLTRYALCTQTLIQWIESIIAYIVHPPPVSLPEQWLQQNMFNFNEVHLNGKLLVNEVYKWMHIFSEISDWSSGVMKTMPLICP